MARTPITPQRAVDTGLELATEPANVDGNAFPSGPGLVLIVNNGSGAEVDVTLVTPLTINGLAVTDRIITIPANESRHIAAENARLYAQPDRTVHVNYEAVTDVTVAVLQV